MLEVDVTNERQVLVIAGDYEIVLQVRQALRGRGFTVQTAYSHRDAVYALQQGQHDLVIVDAAMCDRYSGEQTLAMVAASSLRRPIVALALNGSTPKLPDGLEIIVDSLDETVVRRGVMQALKMPELQLVELSKVQSEPMLRGDTQASEEMQTLLALGRSLTEVLNLSEVLNRVVEAARRLTDAEEGMILLPDKDTGQLWLRAKVGIDVDVARNFRVKTDDTIAGAVFNSGRPILIGEQGPQKVKTEYFVNSLLYVPILLHGKSIGVLGVNNKHKHDVFDIHQQDLLSNLALYAAIAIENARIHEESIRQARELKALVDASHVINSSVVLDRTLPNICEQFVRVLNVSYSEIFDWDSESKQLHSLARYYSALWRPGFEPRISLSSRPALMRALAQNQPLLFTRRDGSGTGETKALQDLGALLFVPIITTSTAIGAIYLYYVRPLESMPAEEAIHRAQRLALQCLVQLAENTVHNTAPLFRIAEDINRLLGADWCDIGMMSPERDQLQLRMAVGRGVWLSPPYPTLEGDRFPHLSAAMEHQSPFQYQLESESLQDSQRDFLSAVRGRSVLGVPLVSRGKTTGLALFVDTQRSTAFGVHEIDLARAMTGHAATALENSRLVHDLEASLRELRETQGRLVQAARLSAMGELAAAVAHQVNNPLTTIVLDAELMLLNETPNSARYEALAAIMRAGKRAASVVRRLLTAVRSTDTDAPMQPIDVVATVVEVIALVKAHIERDRVRLVEKLPDRPLPPVFATPGHLDDVWLNLLLNAHDALQGREGAELGIEVAYNKQEESIDVIVWDNGPGIPANIVDEIFKPFFTTKPVGEGTGLGLHICRQVVERCGGSIDVRSAPEQGTRFLVRLPVTRGE